VVRELEKGGGAARQAAGYWSFGELVDGKQEQEFGGGIREASTGNAERNPGTREDENRAN
jgi:hypothetical protein